MNALDLIVKCTGPFFFIVGGFFFIAVIIKWKTIQKKNDHPFRILLVCIMFILVGILVTYHETI